MDRGKSPDLSGNWVSIRRPPTAITERNGRVGGEGWVDDEIQSPTPTPPRSPRRICRPGRFGSLRRQGFSFPDLLPRRRLAEIPTSNPLPLWAIFHEPVKVSATNSPMTPTVEQAAGEGSPSDWSSESDGLTEAYFVAQDAVKKQMLKMGLDFPSQSDDE